MSDEGKRFLPLSCEHLFDAFHQLRVANNGDLDVYMEQWVKFCCKKTIRYKQPPPRKEKKSAHFKASHNPIGIIEEHINWSSDKESLFRKLGVKGQQVEETYLAAFLSCWLCAFVLPTEKGGFIRLGVFRVACHLACGQRSSLAVPVLASIYRGLNTISKCSQLDTIHACFLIHYVYGWLAYYFKTYYPLPNGPTDPFMDLYSGKGAVRYYEKEEAQKCIYGGGTIVWNAILLERPHAYHYRDDGTEKEHQSNFFMSIRSNYFTLRDRDVFIIEPYSPHRFSRQFDFFQDVPGRLDHDFRETSLIEGLRLARIYVLTKSKARATFLPNDLNMKKFILLNYQSWWDNVHGNFLESHVQFLANEVGLAIDVIQNDEKVLVVSEPPALKSKVVILDEIERPSYYTPLKRPSQDESTSTKSDECWKRLRRPSGTQKDTNLCVVEVTADNISSSRTLIAVKEANGIITLEASKPQNSNESVEKPNLRIPSSAFKSKQKATSTSHGRITTNVEFNAREQPAISMPVFDERKVVSKLRMNFAKEAWAKIHSKLIDLTLDRASSLEDEVQVILEDIDKMGVEFSL